MSHVQQDSRQYFIHIVFVYIEWSIECFSDIRENFASDLLQDFGVN